MTEARDPADPLAVLATPLTETQIRIAEEADRSGANQNDITDYCRRKVAFHRGEPEPPARAPSAQKYNPRSRAPDLEYRLCPLSDLRPAMVEGWRADDPITVWGDNLVMVRVVKHSWTMAGYSW
jgi:hypothetical protein